MSASADTTAILGLAEPATQAADWGFDLHAAALIARQELRLAMRNRWVLLYGALFAALTAAISYFGLTVAEFTGFQGFARTAVSLLNLVVAIVPLAAMLMGVQCFSVEGGATDQLFSEPVTPSEIVLGKLAGMTGASALATLLGFGLSGTLIAWKVGVEGLGSYLMIVLAANLVAVVYLALAALLTVTTGRGLRAYAVVVAVWFLSVVLFDLLVIGASFLMSEAAANRLVLISLFLNPAGSARVGALLLVAGPETFGPAGAILLRSLGGAPQALALLVACLLAWTAACATATVARLKRQDL